MFKMSFDILVVRQFKSRMKIFDISIDIFDIDDIRYDIGDIRYDIGDDRYIDFGPIYSENIRSVVHARVSLIFR